MPCDYKKYPPNWKSEIRPAILKRANNCCEHPQCGAKNGDYGYRDREGKFYSWEYIEQALELYGDDLFDDELSNNIKKDQTAKKGIKIVLTVAHVDHNIENNDYSNLKAWCQYHHLQHDKEQHQTNARQTRNKKKGLQSLF